MQGIDSRRYTRQLQLPGFGPEAQQKLGAAKVLVVGAGGLGVPALQYLAGMGTGGIGIVDEDIVSLSNLHRQVLYTTEEIGQPKAAVAAAKLRALNPDITIQPFPEKLDTRNARSIISSYDIVVDATDNFPARYLINDACVILNKPFVYGAVHQYEGHVSTFNFLGGPTYRCLCPDPPAADTLPDCNAAGVLGVVPGIIGCRQALEVVKIITGIGKSLSGTLLVLDFLNDEQYRMKLRMNPANKAIARLQESYDVPACNSAAALSPDSLREWYRSGKSFLLVDVREPAEFESGHLPEAVNMPMSMLPDAALSIVPSMPAVVYCEKGGRSAKAALVLRGRHPGNTVFELAGGIDNWLKSNPHS